MRLKDVNGSLRPLRVLRTASHPQADAINVLSWVGLLFGAVPWLIALVWAYMKPTGAPVEVGSRRRPAGGEDTRGASC